MLGTGGETMLTPTNTTHVFVYQHFHLCGISPGGGKMLPMFVLALVSYYNYCVCYLTALEAKM